MLQAAIKESTCHLFSRIFFLLFVLVLCPGIEADPICDLAAVTNIQSISDDYAQWSCASVDGSSSTGSSFYCTSPSWPGLICDSQGFVISINLPDLGLQGII